MSPPRVRPNTALASKQVANKAEVPDGIRQIHRMALKKRVDVTKDYLPEPIRAALDAAAKTDPVRDFSCGCEYHTNEIASDDALVASIVWRQDVLRDEFLRGGVNPTEFTLFNAQRKDVLLASVSPFLTAPETGLRGSQSDRRFLAYLDIWTEEFAPLNDQLVKEAVSQYTAQVGTADPQGSITAAGRPSNRLTTAAKTDIRTKITKSLLKGQGGISFDALAARRTLDAVSSAIYGSGGQWATDLMTEEAVKQLGSDLVQYNLLEADDKGGFIKVRQFTARGTVKLDGAISDFFDRTQAYRVFFDKYPKESPERTQAFIKLNESIGENFLNELGKQIAKSNPAVLNRYFPPLTQEVMKDIQTQVRAQYTGMVDKLLEDVDGYLLEGATTEEALIRAQAARPENIREGDLKAKRRQREFDAKYGADSKISPRLSGMAEDLANYNANLALDEFAKAEKRRGKVIKQRWHATLIETRPTHVQANGQTVEVGQSFTVGGYSAQYPHDPSLPPKERYNCRCQIILVEQDSVNQQERLFDIGANPKL